MKKKLFAHKNKKKTQQINMYSSQVAKPMQTKNSEGSILQFYR